MYKSQRQEIPDSLKSQFPILHEAIDAMGVNKSSVLGFEADDVIATYARIYSEMYGNVVIISSDKDMLQLVLDDVIAVYDDSKKKLYKENDVLIKFGIPAAAVADYLALVGDASDNVPGVRSIGPKIATMLIKEYGTISNLYSNLVAITNLRIKKALEIGKDLALTSLQLTVLDKHVQGLSALDDLSFSSFCLDSMANFARKYEFKSMHNINIT